MELAAFTHDAATLVTLESMPRECSGGSERWQSLKFWDVHSTGSGQTGYTVNSFVDDPSFGTITSLACHPTDVLVATTCVPVRQGLGIGSGEGVSGQTGSVRLWRKRHFRRPPGAPADSPTWHWRCSTARTYKGALDHSFLTPCAAARIVFVLAYQSHSFCREDTNATHYQCKTP